MISVSELRSPAMLNDVRWQVRLRLSEMAVEADLVAPSIPPPERPSATTLFQPFDPSDTPAAVSPLQADIWEVLLIDYPNRAFVENSSVSSNTVRSWAIRVLYVKKVDRQTVFRICR